MSFDQIISGAESQDFAIDVAGLSKCYLVYTKPENRLKQSILPRLSRIVGRQPVNYYSEFWALHDVNFRVSRGETVGIIGRNGSGKSTLLQMVCGTLTPTSGQVTVNGRVGALLELGSGFNPEFSGRENVLLNATVLGLTDQQVRHRFEDIERFADIGEFIDQPVKTYSSGMVVRLAFAVIAHIDADILVIDEALAVGDAVFTQKCMRFLRAFKKKGTILFVSHDASSILNLCDRAIWLDKGKLRLSGSASDVSNAYIEFSQQEVYGDEVKLRSLKIYEGLDADGDLPQGNEAEAADHTNVVTYFDNIANSDGWTTGGAEITDVALSTADGQIVGNLVGGEMVQLEVKAIVKSDLDSPIIGFFVKDRLGQSLFGEHTYTYQPKMSTVAGDQISAIFRFRLPMLPNGVYSLTVSIADGEPFNHVQHHWLHDALIMNVTSEKLRYGLVGIPFEKVKLKRNVE